MPQGRLEMSESEPVDIQASLLWRRSSACHPVDCVEVAITPGRVLVRDSKDRLGPVLEFSAGAWRGFLQDVTQGNFTIQ
jgi:hypothetical protein